MRDSLSVDPITLTFGPHGFFGYSPTSPLDTTPDSDKQVMWWSTYQADSAPGRDLALTALREQLLERHGEWISPYDATGGTPLYRVLIELACGAPDAGVTARDRDILVLPTFTTPRLPRWATASGRIVLLGDAAHAVPPDSGQGVSAALEDALALAMLLRHFHAANESTSVMRAAQGYQALRMRRVGSILDRSRRLGDSKRPQKQWQERVRDFAMSLICQSNPHFLLFLMANVAGIRQTPRIFHA